MLREIICDQFTQNKITFHEGLNVVLGDDQASNSIGKSSLLMVIDFVFGGNSLATIRRDIIENLGDHAYKFCFEFKNQTFYFRRETYDPKVVYKCDENYKDKQTISITEYTDFLSKNYGLRSDQLTFRAIVSPYSRVWRKGNDDVKKPLNADKKQKEIEAIKNLIKLFKKYEGIKELEKQWKELSESKKSLADALKNEHIPQINKKEYVSNENRMVLINNEITEIKQNLASHACTIKELINREILDLKKEKDALLTDRMAVENKLNRVDRNLDAHSFVRSRNVEKLKEFFPEVNVHKISEIEDFHEGIKKILEKELRASKKGLQKELDDVEAAIMQLNKQISGLINSEVENPSQIIDRVVKLNSERHKINQENFFYDRKNSITEDEKDIKERFLAEKQKVCDAVSGAINNKVRQITTDVYSKDRHAAKLKIIDNSYLYETYEDTGTGKAYSDLIIFDLAVFEMTELPFIIHDSILFKNIENEAVSKLVQYYGSDKQVFISIDEIQKYDEAAEILLEKQKVIKLDDDKQLYTTDWR